MFRTSCAAIALAGTALRRAGQFNSGQDVASQLCKLGNLLPVPALSAQAKRRPQQPFGLAGYASAQVDYSKQVDEVNELFTIARDEIEYAQEESETVYFNDAIKDATTAVEACLNKWRALLDSLPEDEKMRLQRGMGMKMEQLKAEFDQVKNLHLEDH